MENPAAAAAHGRIIASGFRPHPLLRSNHAQTVFAARLRPLPPLQLRRERLELDDGDFLDLGWSGDGRPLAILLHGLGSGFDAKYARGTARQLHARGWRTVALQMRGRARNRTACRAVTTRATLTTCSTCAACCARGNRRRRCSPSAGHWAQTSCSRPWARPATTFR
jgi:predicted alpha/beta-fold hydrolase